MGKNFIQGTMMKTSFVFRNRSLFEEKGSTSGASSPIFRIPEKTIPKPEHEVTYILSEDEDDEEEAINIQDWPSEDEESRHFITRIG